MAWCSQPIELTANIVDSDHLQHPIWPMEKHICVLPCNQIEFGKYHLPRNLNSSIQFGLGGVDWTNNGIGNNHRHSGMLLSLPNGRAQLPPVIGSPVHPQGGDWM